MKNDKWLVEVEGESCFVEPRKGKGTGSAAVSEEIAMRIIDGVSSCYLYSTIWKRCAYDEINNCLDEISTSDYPDKEVMIMEYTAFFKQHWHESAIKEALHKCGDFPRCDYKNSYQEPKAKSQGPEN